MISALVQCELGPHSSCESHLNAMGLACLPRDDAADRQQPGAGQARCQPTGKAVAHKTAIAAHARLGIKASYPFAEGAPGLVPGVEHVTAAEMTDEQLLALLRQQLHLLNQP